MDTDYLTIYGILGVLQHPTFAAVAVITAAAKVATINGAAYYRVIKTQVFTARNETPKSFVDARCGPCLLRTERSAATLPPVGPRLNC